MARSKSSDRWMQRHVSDEFVKRAQKDGYRSRAAYKLEELDRVDKLLRPGAIVVDLGAAPGGWAQYAARRFGGKGRLLALDLLPMESIEGVEILLGDFTESAVLDSLKMRLAGAAVDLVMSDMAPNISGVAMRDQAQAIYLAELAMDFAAETLKPGGDVVLKTFQGEGYPALHRMMKTCFDRLATRKPKASRAESREIYLVGKGFRGRPAG